MRGTTHLAYGAVCGVLDSIITPYSDTIGYTFDARSRAAGHWAAHGPDPAFAVTQNWDDVGKLVGLTTRQPDAVTVGDWAVDGAMPDLDLRTVWQDTLGLAEDTLGHDAWRRVTAIQYLRNGSQLAAETFTFTRGGNISKKTETRTYDLSTGRMTARDGGSYSYDRAGNLVSWTPAGGTTWTYTYDPLDRLVAARHGDTLVARYAYDVLGRRIVKRVYSGATAGYLRMIYAGDAVVAEADSGGTLTLGYTWGFGADNLVAVHRYSDSGHWYVVQDQLHSVRGLLRRDGTWVVSWRYRIYGAGLDSVGTAPFALRYRWTGREYDGETGFYYFRARYYEPGSQRFVQEDPIGYAGGATLYGYADGNPVAARDPSGLEAQPDPEDPSPYACLGTLRGCGGLPIHDEWGGGGSDWDGDGRDDGAEFYGEIYAYQAYARAADEPMQREQDRAYQNAMACGFNTQTCSADANWIAPLTGSQFHFLLLGQNAAITQITSSWLRGLVVDWIMAGNVMTASDSYFRGTAGYAGGTTIPLAAGTLTLLPPSLLQRNVSSSGEMANTLLHEWGHYLGMPGRTMCSMADRYSPVQRGVSACSSPGH